MVLMHLLLKERISLNRLSTLALAEVEVVVEAKEVAKVNFVKDSQIRGTQVVGETSFEAGGVREAEVQERTGNKMLQMTESVGIVARKVTCHVTVQRERQVKRENRATMHLLVEMQVKEEVNACLLCSM